MPQRNVNLTEHLDQFIDAAIESGRFSNASEIVREGLRLLEQRDREDQARIEWLRSAAKEGFDAMERGDYTALSSDEEITGLMEEIHKEAAAERTSNSA